MVSFRDARALTVLGLESTCDETAAAVVRAPLSGAAATGLCAMGPGAILSSVIWGQAGLHAPFGGVVPEIAARAHAERLDLCVEAALAEAGVGLGALDGVAVAAGPGLIGGVIAGVMTAKGLAHGAGLPLIGVNHLEGHALTPRLTDGLAFPYLLLLVSGGHCQLVAVDGVGPARGSAGPSTTRRARPSTRSRNTSASATPAGRRWSARRRRATRRASPCRGRCSTAPAATSASRG